MKQATKQKTIADLMTLAPCPVIHSVNELPSTDWRYGKPSRSCYFPKRTGKWARLQDFIHINEGDARGVRYISTLAHEVGHALDRHNTHPAQHLLPGSRQGRYRIELAAVAFQVRVLQSLRLHNTPTGQRHIGLAIDYLNRYEQGLNPPLEVAIKALKGFRLGNIPAPVLNEAHVGAVEELVTVAEAAKQTGYSQYRTSLMAKESRLVGARKVTGKWMIPTPVMLRTKDGTEMAWKR